MSVECQIDADKAVADLLKSMPPAGSVAGAYLTSKFDEPGIERLLDAAPLLRRRPDQYTFNVKSYAGLPCPNRAFEKIVARNLETAKQITLYVHFPYCAYVCSFCHYDVRVAPGGDAFERHTAKVIQEIDAALAKNPALADIPVTSIYFGGGTPSLQSPATLRRLADHIRARFRVVPHCELTLESTPNALSDETTAAWRDAGVNRLSLGVEVLDDDALTYLKRRHTRDQAIAACTEYAPRFAQTNCDLMYGLPGVPRNQLTDDAKILTGLGITQLTAYRLRLGRLDERNAGLASVFRKRPEDFPSQAATALQYLCIRSQMQEGGWSEHPIGWFNRRASASCYADRWENDAVLLGFGPSAYSYGNGWQRVNPRYADWNASEPCELVDASMKWRFDDSQQGARQLMFSLRATGQAKQDLWHERQGVADYLAELGLAEHKDDCVALTPLGLAFLDEIIDQALQ